MGLVERLSNWWKEGYEIALLELQWGRLHFAEKRELEEETMFQAVEQWWTLVGQQMEKNLEMVMLSSNQYPDVQTHELQCSIIKIRKINCFAKS